MSSIAFDSRDKKTAFLLANVIEAFERLAFFGVRAVLPLYLVGSDGNGLGLTYSQKGIIYMVWALIQCLLPMVSGGYSERYGYKKSIILALAINALGYVFMGLATNFVTMFIACCMVGTGTAIFKPPVQGTVASSLNEKNSSFGFGVFYWVVNIGGFLAPFLASMLRGDDANPTWNLLFQSAATVSVVNILFTLFFFKELQRNSEAFSGKSSAQVFAETMRTLFKDTALLGFLLIVSGFWFMFMQLSDLLPNFIKEWIDTRDIGAFLIRMRLYWLVSADGAAKPEILINIDAAVIILLVLPMSYILRRFNMIVPLTVGMLIATVGFVGAGMINLGFWCAFFIFVFAIGEIICSPKFSEFIGMTAPEGKKALYMGYSNMPFAIGWALGNLVSGPLYEKFASKAVFAKQYLETNACSMMLDGVNEAKTKSVTTLTKLVAQCMGNNADVYDANRLLWDINHPWIIWVCLGAVGFVSLFGMIVFYIKKMKVKNSAES